MARPRRTRGRPFDYDLAGTLLAELFRGAEEKFREGNSPDTPAHLAQAADILFSSNTQAYRETLVGCGLARLVDLSANIRHPYVNQSERAYNGRTLDERVVNPFLRDRMIPCSSGPFLSAFRRNVQFVAETARGLRDQAGYSAFLDYVSALETAADSQGIREKLSYLLYRFVALRDSANVSLSRIHRLSLEQYEILIGELLGTPSGGILPVLLSVALFETLKKRFDLGWQVEWQGINVADRASGAGGDITIRKDDSIVLAIEVTERPINRARVISTFRTKISPQSIEDYLFLFTSTPPSEDALAAARQVFAQGHDVNFLSVQSWIINALGVIGPAGRNLFTDEFLALLGGQGIPSTIKGTWNDRIRAIVG